MPRLTLERLPRQPKVVKVPRRRKNYLTADGTLKLLPEVVAELDRRHGPQRVKKK